MAVGNHYRRAGSFESTAQADSYTDVAAGGHDLDTGGTFAQFYAKGPGSIGVKIRTILAGVATTVATWTAAGALTLLGGLTMTSGTTLAAQALTATTIVTSSTAAIGGSFATGGSTLTGLDAGGGIGMPNNVAIRVRNSTNAAYYHFMSLNTSDFFDLDAAQRGIRTSGTMGLGGATPHATIPILATTSASNNSGTFQNSHASAPFGINLSFSAAAPNGTSNQFWECNDSGTNRATLRSNGGLANFSANNVNLSDRRLKTAIAEMPSLWEAHLLFPYRVFKFNDQTHGDLNYGTVVQDVQAAYAGTAHAQLLDSLVDDSNPKRLGIYETDRNYMVGAVLQECQRRITQLERRLAS